MPDLTMTEAARRLGISRQSVWWLITSGKLTARRVTVRGQPRPLWLVATTDVDEYSKQRGDRLGTPGRTSGEG